MSPVVLEGERVTLRPFFEDEAEELLDARAFSATEDGRSADPEKIRSLIEMSGSWSDGPAGLVLAIEADGRLVGELQARGGRAQLLPDGVFELGIELYSPQDRGRGLGTAALVEVTRYLIEEEHAHRVQISTDVENVSMRRACERAGFTYEGVLRGFMGSANGPRDFAMYGITSSDLRKD